MSSEIERFGRFGQYLLYSEYERVVASVAARAMEQIDSMNAVHEAEVARLRAEVERLRNVLSPFAEYERVRSTMGGTSPKSGQLLGVHSSAGSAELSVEDFKAAIAAMGASA